MFQLFGKLSEELSGKIPGAKTNSDFGHREYLW